jgi:hypothetical protein
MPTLTGAEEPLNQFCSARIFGCDAFESVAPLEGMKLASDLLGECERIDADAFEVCCCIVVDARLRNGWQFSMKVPAVKVRWWLLRADSG